MPLHSSATRMVMFGSWNSVPSLRWGGPQRSKKIFAADADAFIDHVSRVFTMASGIGIMKIRKHQAKVAAFIQFVPRKKKPPPASKEIKASVLRARRSFSLRLLVAGLQFKIAAPSPMGTKRRVHPHLKV